MTHIKAIVFDCFGVLSVEGWLPFKKEHFGSDPDLFQQATDLAKRANTGHMSYRDFLAGVADLAGVPHEEARKRIESNAANAELFDYIAVELKPTYKIGMLSNAAGNWMEELFTPQQRQVFDAVALSFELGVVKPDPRAYEAIAYQLGVELSECVFVDDQEGYCTAARQCGMQAIVYKDNEQMKDELKKILD